MHTVAQIDGRMIVRRAFLRRDGLDIRQGRWCAQIEYAATLESECIAAT